jgi:LysM repeat protein
MTWTFTAGGAPIGGGGGSTARCRSVEGETGPAAAPAATTGSGIRPSRYDRRVTDRGLPVGDGANACPFVAFDDDRDERSTVPDHRHRCYAEIRPAPRALAHQEAYCLSSAFPVCPTFQDWARREAARARAGAPPVDATIGAGPEDRHVDEPVVGAGLAAVAGADAVDASPDAELDVEPEDDEPESEAAAASRATSEAWEANAVREAGEREARRNPPRDWSAPPPWLASAEAANRSTAPAEDAEFIPRRDPSAGLAGSAADRLAGGSRPPRQPASRPRPSGPPPELDAEPDLEARDRPRPAVPPRRPRAYDQHLGGPSDGPDWERPRRYEAYPTIRTRIGMPQIPRLAVMAAAIGIAALALFFLPALLGLGENEQAAASPTAVASPSQSIAPTQTPAPTPTVYTVQAGDTLSKIAIDHGVTIEEILAANPDIANPNEIAQGQQITIPAPSPEAPAVIGGSPSPTASGEALP